MDSFVFFFFFSSRRRHTRYWRDWSSDVCSSDLLLRYKGSSSQFLYRFIIVSKIPVPARAHIHTQILFREHGLRKHRPRLVEQHRFVFVTGGEMPDDQSLHIRIGGHACRLSRSGMKRLPGARLLVLRERSLMKQQVGTFYLLRNLRVESRIGTIS